MNEINFKQLEAFSSVARNNSFSKAGKELYLSQSTISTHISNLELALGCKLFDRKSGNKPSLTSDGKRVFKEVQIILEHCNALYKIKPNSDMLNLGASTVPGKYLLPALTASFHNLFNECRFKICNGNSGDVYKLLEAGEISVGLVGERQNNKDFAHKLLCRDKFVIIAPNQEPYKSLSPSSSPLDLILNSPFLIREKSSGTRRFLEEYLKGHGKKLDEIDVVAEYDDTEAIKLSVNQNMGISVLSVLSVGEEIKDKKLLAFDLEEENSFREIYIVKRKDKLLSPLEQKFIKFSVENANKIITKY